METKVVNIKTDKCDVKICRRPDGSIPAPPKAGCFGNPFFLKDVNNDEERAECIAKFREYFYKRIEVDQNFKKAVEGLRGKKLGCFCAPKPCHGDVYKEYLDA